jgi:hypothetical protein
MADPGKDIRSALDTGGLSAILGELAHAPERDPRAWDAFFRPGRMAGRFELLREIGRGSFGVVFEARDAELGRRVAFKALRPGPGARDRASQDILRREAEAAAHLNHPNICTLFDVGHCEGGIYLVLERLEGETLERLLRRGPLPPDRALDIVIQVARALAHAHAAGVVHRDLKPANVFLTDRGEVKVFDFGLAQFLGETLHRRAGSPAYMAPEQWRGETTDPRTDVFAVGVMTFEMITGRRPFEVSGDHSTVLDDGPAPPIPPDLASHRISALVARMLAKRPGDRPANGQVLLEALLGPHPSGRVETFVAELYRRRVPAATMAYLAASFVVLLVAEAVAWAMDLPNWVLRAAGVLVLLGLPVNVVLAWYLDVVPGDRGRPPTFPRKPAPVAVAVMVALATAGAAWRFWPGPEPLPGVPLRVVVADFANETGDRDLDGLSGMLAASLERSRRLSVMSRGRMFEVLGETNGVAEGTIDESRGREVARRSGLTGLVLGSVHRFDDVYAVDVKVLDPVSGEYLLAVQDRGKGKSSIPVVLDRLASRVRQGFREPSEDIERRRGSESRR